MKRCGKCKALLDLDLFHNNKGRADGKSGWCKECMYPILKQQNNKALMEQRERKLQRSIRNFKSLPGELWKDVIGYEGVYQVSNLGRLRNIKSY